MRPLTVDLTQLDRRPYFLWDEDVSVAELSEVQVPDGIALPGDVRPDELRAFVRQLVVRLRRAALPVT